jgi:hypothetical protein
MKRPIRLSASAGLLQCWQAVRRCCAERAQGCRLVLQHGRHSELYTHAYRIASAPPGTQILLLTLRARIVLPCSPMNTPQRAVWDGHPVELGDAWILR